MIQFWKKSAMDERFVMHRLYSTRFATVVTAVFIGVWLLFDLYVNGVLRRDFMIILTVTAVTKLLAMLYYRLTH
jgi:hypothetical protein